MAEPIKTAGGRHCWWCGARSTSENPLTNEHIIAKWFAKVMRGEGRMNHAYREHGAIEDARSWSSREPSFKASVVCEQCNNGWMSSLETEAERLLPDLIHAEPRLALGFDNAPVLARWAAKTALMFQGMEPTENRVVPAEHYPLLRTSKLSPLPSIMRVWVGAVQSNGVRATAFGGTIDLAHRPARFYTLLLAIDYVAFMVIGAEEPEALAKTKLGVLTDGWTPLWPMTAPAAWPPARIWGVDELLEMSRLMEAATRRQALAARAARPWSHWSRRLRTEPARSRCRGRPGAPPRKSFRPRLCPKTRQLAGSFT